MNTVNRIALFEMSPGSVTGMLIALGTRSTIVHAATQHGRSGQWFDASESRGDFNFMDTLSYQKRMCYLIEFEGDLDDWLRKMQGKLYDYRGVVGWLLCRLATPIHRMGFKTLAGRWACGSKGKFYCFEASWLALLGEVPEGAVSGKDLLRLATERGCTVRYGRFGDIAT